LGLDERKLQRLGRQRPAGTLVQALHQGLGALGRGLGAVDAELGVTPAQLDAQRRLDLAQVGVQAAADARQAGVVDGVEGESQGHGEQKRVDVHSRWCIPARARCAAPAQCRPMTAKNALRAKSLRRLPLFLLVSAALLAPAAAQARSQAGLYWAATLHGWAAAMLALMATVVGLVSGLHH